MGDGRSDHATYVYVWKDLIDHTQFLVGVRSNTGYAVWTVLLIDGIEEIFGKEVKEIVAKSLPGQINELSVITRHTGMVK